MNFTLSESPLVPERGLPEALARTLRHEVGDFLQKVYATVAILQARLPAEWTQEREVLARLRRRGEQCRQLLDDLQDFLCPMSLACETTDLSHLAVKLTTAARERYPQLEWVAEPLEPASLTADPGRLAQVGEILLENASQDGRRRIRFHTRTDPSAREVEWLVTDDGPGVPPGSLDKLFQPFFTTRAGHAGLGLALAHKIVTLHGGRIQAGNVAGGGFQVCVRLPLRLEK